MFVTFNCRFWNITVRFKTTLDLYFFIGLPPEKYNDLTIEYLKITLFERSTFHDWTVKIFVLSFTILVQVKVTVLQMTDTSTRFFNFIV